jgi:hypothetical protein
VIWRSCSTTVVISVMVSTPPMTWPCSSCSTMAFFKRWISLPSLWRTVQRLFFTRPFSNRPQAMRPFSSWQAMQVSDSKTAQGWPSTSSLV